RGSPGSSWRSTGCPWPDRASTSGSTRLHFTPALHRRAPSVTATPAPTDERSEPHRNVRLERDGCACAAREVDGAVGLDCGDAPLVELQDELTRAVEVTSGCRLRRCRAKRATGSGLPS